MGLGQDELVWIQRGVGGLLFLISAYIVPTLSRKAANWVREGAQYYLSGHLMMATRTTVVLIVPFCVVITFNQDCFAKWLQLWNPCQDSSQFSITFQQPEYAYVKGVFTLVDHVPTPIIDHEDVCRPSYISDGRCPRAVLSVLGSLVETKLLFGVVAAPAIALLLSTPPAMKFQLWFYKKILRKPADYTLKQQLDTEIAGLFTC